MSNDDLKKQAQTKLTEARRLIGEAGELAKQGQFSLYFGEIGQFVPKSAFDLEQYREKATEEAKKHTKEWDVMSESAREELVMDYMTDWRNEDLPYELAQYGDESDGDRWWHPSRC